MTELTAKMVDVSGAAPRTQYHWPALLIPKEQIDAEIERLADSPLPANGRRAAQITHPMAVAPGLGLAPGVDVTINVLKPGEKSVPVRRNSTQLDIVIRGSGKATIAGSDFAVENLDVWNTPSMQAHECTNTGSDLLVRLTYSNAPVLEKLEVHFVEENPAPLPIVDEATAAPAVRSRDYADLIKMPEGGGYLMGYEYLVDIDVVESKALHWPWRIVSQHLPKVHDFARGYNGRRLYILYNPATERRNGTTPSFFATLSCTPPNNINKPHRHSSSAINYYFRGNGHSIVEGKRFDWKAGDLMLSAPGWAVHAHFSGSEATSALTVQDHPFQIAMESLVWQEKLEEPVRTLGAQRGFETNRAALVGAK